MVELQEKGAPVTIQKIAIHPLRDVKRLRGTLEEILMQREYSKDYVSVTVTDEVEPYRMREQLEDQFPYLLEVRVDNTRTKNSLTEKEEDIDISSPLDTFAGFFQEMQGRGLTDQEWDILKNIMKESEE